MIVSSPMKMSRSQNATTTATTSRLECRGRRGETEEDDHDKGTDGFFFGGIRDEEIVDETKKKASASASSSSAFHNSGGFLYVRNFFDPEDFKIIERACDDLRKHLKEEKRTSRLKMGVMVPEEGVVHQMCCSEFAAEKLRETGVVRRR